MASIVLTPEQMREKLAGREVVFNADQMATVRMGTGEADVRSRAAQRKAEQVSQQLADVKEKLKRKKMTPQEIREGLDLLFQKYDYSPVENLIITSQQTDDQSLSTRIDMFLTEFFIPKLKSVEVSGQVDHQHDVIIRRFGSAGEIIDEPLKKILGLPSADSEAKSVEKTIDVEVSRA